MLGVRFGFVRAINIASITYDEKNLNTAKRRLIVVVITAKMQSAVSAFIRQSLLIDQRILLVAVQVLLHDAPEIGLDAVPVAVDLQKFPQVMNDEDSDFLEQVFQNGTSSVVAGAEVSCTTPLL